MLLLRKSQITRVQNATAEFDDEFVMNTQYVINASTRNTDQLPPVIEFNWTRQKYTEKPKPTDASLTCKNCSYEYFSLRMCTTAVHNATQNSSTWKGLVVHRGKGLLSTDQ